MRLTAAVDTGSERTGRKKGDGRIWLSGSGLDPVLHRLWRIDLKIIMGVR